MGNRMFLFGEEPDTIACLLNSDGDMALRPNR